MQIDKKYDNNSYKNKLHNNLIDSNRYSVKSDEKLINLKKNIKNKNKEKYSYKNKNYKNELIDKEIKIDDKKSIKSNNNSDNSEINKEENFFNDYLSKPIEEMDFYDAYKFDKRNFCESFCDLIFDKIITIDTFFKSEPTKPKILKIIIFILYIDLIFIINGLFFSEDYISQVYHLEKEEKFFSFIPRSINRLIYTFFAGTIIQFLINCFFIPEKKIKRIFIREKENINSLKKEIIILIKKIKKRLIAFFIIVIIIFIFSFLYVVSFNYVYHFTQFEWIKSSIFIFIIIELLMLLISFIVTIIRIISFCCKSDRLYNLSNFINRI